MRVDLSVVLSLFSGLLSVGFALYLAVLKYAIANREKEIDRRIDGLQAAQVATGTAFAAELRSLQERLHTEEKATIRQDGEVALVRQAHDNIWGDLEEVKRMLNQILAELRGRPGGPGGYSSHSSGGYPSTTTQPRKDPSK